MSPADTTTVRPRLQRVPRPLIWLVVVGLLGLLAWQGHRIAHLLPWIDERIAALGVWGPVVYVAGVLLLAPLLAPDTLFGLAAGLAFGLWKGFLYYFAAEYVACLCVAVVARRWLSRRVFDMLAGRPALARVASVASRQGVRFTAWVRLVPINPALVSYALGAAGVPLRSIAIGTLAMFPHMFLTVYFAVAAAHVTRMAGRSHAEWAVDGVALLVGFAACAGLVAQLSARAAREVRAAADEPSEDATPSDPDD